ncbi:DUF4429 domain-containing protein [Streptomyces sp. NPDC021622]|uniref:DUF4429 domain-containing protein n=1 Tax=Streptomyces sp. NPDC021622 TaxID=3155013 RepID=UPI0033E794F6
MSHTEPQIRHARKQQARLVRASVVPVAGAHRACHDVGKSNWGHAMIKVSGKGGQIEFDGEYVTITRKGFLTRGGVGKGHKRLHVSQIAAVQWKPAGPLVNGFIQFTVPGGIERRSQFGNQSLRAAQDENSVMFTKKQQPEFEELRVALDEAIATQHGTHSVPATPASIADELSKLAQLREQGVLSPEEFEAQKAKLLGQ